MSYVYLLEKHSLKTTFKATADSRNEETLLTMAMLMSNREYCWESTTIRHGDLGHYIIYFCRSDLFILIAAPAALTEHEFQILQTIIENSEMEELK